ncbi:MAG: cytochrome c biogenesis protein [Candidatus Aquicultorales bacterium]
MKAIYLVYSLPVILAAILVCYFPAARKWVSDVFTVGRLAVGSVAILLTGFVMAFAVAPAATLTDGVTADYAQKIFYFHVPVAITSFVGFILAAVFGGLFLAKRERRYDYLSYTTVQVGFVYGLLTELTGVIWDKAAWGVWWQWEPRLTTYLILMLMYSGYFILRSSMSEESSRARFSSVYSIIAAVSVPLTFFSIRLIPSVHPVVFSTSGSHMPAVMTISFMVAMAGMVLFSFALIRTRYTVYQLTEEIEYLQEKLGG